MNIPTNPDDKVALNTNIALGGETKNLISKIISILECPTDLREQFLTIGKIYIIKSKMQEFLKYFDSSFSDQRSFLPQLRYYHTMRVNGQYLNLELFFPEINDIFFNKIFKYPGCFNFFLKPTFVIRFFPKKLQNNNILTVQNFISGCPKSVLSSIRLDSGSINLLYNPKVGNALGVIKTFYPLLNPLELGNFESDLGKINRLGDFVIDNITPKGPEGTNAGSTNIAPIPHITIAK